jgi:hypothetical protein
MTTTQSYILTPMLGLAVLRVLALALLPLAPLVAGVAVTGGARRRWTARLSDLAAVALGILAAPLLLATDPLQPLLDPADIFRAGGPWDLSFDGFIAQRVLPLLAAPFDLIAALAAGRAGPDVTRGAILFAAAALPLLLGPALAWHDRRGLTRSGRNVFLVLWGSYATLYSVFVVAWLANTLNFWCFLVLFAASLLLRD